MQYKTRDLAFHLPKHLMLKLLLKKWRNGYWKEIIKESMTYSSRVYLIFGLHLCLQPTAKYAKLYGPGFHNLHHHLNTPIFGHVYMQMQKYQDQMFCLFIWRTITLFAAGLKSIPQETLHASMKHLCLLMKKMLCGMLVATLLEK